MLFKQLSIYKSRYVNILTRSTRDDLNDIEGMEEPKFILNHKECSNFLELEAQHIEILKVQGDLSEEYKKLEYFQFNVKPFKKLIKLILYEMVVTNQDLLLISQSCKNLRSLNLLKCFCEDYQDLLPGINMNINYICKMSKLQKFRLETEAANGVRELKFKYLKHLLRNSKHLRVIDFKNISIICEEKDKDDEEFFTEKWDLEILNLGLITKDFWCTFTGFLKNLHNLKDLTLSAINAEDIVFNIEIIYILSKYCQKLQRLSLKNCKLDVEDFMPLQNLKDLSLISCQGFLFENLQQVLGGLKLNTFKLINTPVLEISNSIYISPSLKHITIDTTNYEEISEIFQCSLNNFEGLQSINWCKGDIKHNWIVDKCPNLKKLTTTNSHHLSRLMLTFKSLQELIITTSQGLRWTPLRSLISKLSLKRLEINTDDIILDKIMTQDCEKFHTSLEYLKIPYQIFIEQIRYWLNVLDVNEEFNMVVYGKAEEILNVRLLCLLLAEDCIQMRMKRIKICGFNLRLNDFDRNSIFTAFVILHMNTQIYKYKNSPFTLQL